MYESVWGFPFFNFCYYLTLAFVRKFIQYQTCPILANVVSFYLCSIAYLPPGYSVF